MPFIQTLLQWVSENIGGLVAGLSMVLALEVAIQGIYRDQKMQKEIERDKHDIEHSQSRQTQNYLDSILVVGGGGGGGLGSNTSYEYHKEIPNKWSEDPEWSGMITSGSCCMSMSNATYSRSNRKWKEELPKPKETNEPRRLFCCSCNGYTYSDSHGSCMNCGHVREKVIEPITLYQ